MVNTPTRGIGDRTLDIIRQTARQHNLTMWRACSQLLTEKVLAGRAGNAVRTFMDLIVKLAIETKELPLHLIVDSAVIESGLKAMYEAEKGDKAQARLENLAELVTAAKSFEVPEELEEMSEVDAFLSHAALEAGEGQADAFTDAVQLMTLHSAKGLEFPVVFMAGVEEGLFPSKMALEEGDRLEEERRLCYVGMTRAMHKLYICHAESRRIYGREEFARPSRFLAEIPEQHVETVRMKVSVSSPSFSEPSASKLAAKWQGDNEANFRVGQKVQHHKFGVGQVTAFEGSGDKARVQVHFAQVGSKWLLVSLARLEAI